MSIYTEVCAKLSIKVEETTKGEIKFFNSKCKLRVTKSAVSRGIKEEFNGVTFADFIASFKEHKKDTLKKKAMTDCCNGRNLAGWAFKSKNPAEIEKAAAKYELTVDELKNIFDSIETEKKERINIMENTKITTENNGVIVEKAAPTENENNGAIVEITAPTENENNGAIVEITNDNVKKLDTLIAVYNQGAVIMKAGMSIKMTALAIIDFTNLYTEKGYDTIVEFSEKELKLSPQTTRRYLQTAKKFYDIETIAKNFNVNDLLDDNGNFKKLYAFKVDSVFADSQGNDFTPTVLNEIAALPVNTVKELLAKNEISYEMTGSEIKSALAPYRKQAKKAERQAAKISATTNANNGGIVENATPTENVKFEHADKIDNAENVITEIEKLQAQIAALQAENENLKSANETLTVENRQIDKLIADNIALTFENKKLKNTISTMEEKNKASVETLQTENATLQASVETLQTENATLQASVETLQTENATLQASVETLQTDNTQLKNSNNSFKSANSKKQNTIKTLQTENATLKAEIDTLKGAADNNNVNPASSENVTIVG